MLGKKGSSPFFIYHSKKEKTIKKEKKTKSLQRGSKVKRKGG